jgi:hypothetical protein
MVNRGLIADRAGANGTAAAMTSIGGIGGRIAATTVGAAIAVGAAVNAGGPGSPAMTAPAQRPSAKPAPSTPHARFLVPNTADARGQVNV